MVDTSIRCCPDSDTPVIPLDEVKRFIRECLELNDVEEETVDLITENILYSDYRGHSNEGLDNLDKILKELVNETCDLQAVPEIIKQSASTALVDGKNALGVVVGKFCINIAIEKAKAEGIGWVCAKGSNFYGSGAYYAEIAMQEGLIGLAFSNTAPFMVPTRGLQAALGTNPIAVAAPANNDRFVLDMTTTTVSLDKVEMKKRKRQPMPEGWASTRGGTITTNAVEALKGKLLLPLGGTEPNANYKGYGLGLMVEMFCGILSGGPYGPNIRKNGDTSVPAELSQCFIVVNPDFFASGFQDSMAAFLSTLRSMDPNDPTKPILCPGDLEKEHMAKVDTAGGFQYTRDLLKRCTQIAAELSIHPLRNVDELKAETSDTNISADAQSR